jgi:CARDB
MTLTHGRRGGLLALTAVMTSLALAGGISTANAACPRDQICQPAEPPPPLPDLVVVRSPTADPSHVTVKNIGKARAGAFTVKIAAVSGESAEIRRSISGLAVGASTTFAVAPVCETARPVLVDSDKTVAESNETNNAGLLPGKVC